MKGIKRLRDLECEEVSLVDKGANQKRFLIIKAQGETMSKPDLKVDAKIMDKVTEVVSKMTVVDPKDATKTQIISEDVRKSMTAAARLLAAVSQVEAINNQHIEQLIQAVGIPTAVVKGSECDYGTMRKAMGMDETVSPEHAEEALKYAKKSMYDCLSKLGYAANADMIDTQKSVDDDEEEEDVEKSDITKALESVPKEQRAALELIFKQNEDLAKANKELAEKVQKSEKDLADRDSRDLQREFVAKAESFEHIGLPKEKIVKALELAHKAGKESYDGLLEQYETINKQMGETKLMTEVGSRQSNVSKGSALAKIDAAVDAIVQKSSGKTRAQIYSEYIETPEGRELYNQSEKERGGI